MFLSPRFFRSKTHSKAKVVVKGQEPLGRVLPLCAILAGLGYWIFLCFHGSLCYLLLKQVNKSLSFGVLPICSLSVCVFPERGLGQVSDISASEPKT